MAAATSQLLSAYQLHFDTMSCIAPVAASGSRELLGPRRRLGARRRTLGGAVSAQGSRSSEAVESPALVPLGRTSLRVSPLGIGTLQWGDASTGYGVGYSRADLTAAFDALVAGGINFFDTAEVYGYQSMKAGSSAENILGELVPASKASGGGGPPVVVGTKFFTIPWTNLLIGGGFRLGRQSMMEALRGSLKRLNTEQVDLYQIHFPFPTFSNRTLMEGLREAVDEGLATAVGVSNYSRQQMEEAHDILGSFGIPLASNQVKYSLLSRAPEKTGLLQACKDRGVTLIAYSPLDSGLLTDKARSREDSSGKLVRPLLELMADLGARHGNKTVTQVALNYLICKGALPIPACKSAEQAAGHLGVLGWKLAEGEVRALELQSSALGF